jgi:hypothetical protein
VSVAARASAAESRQAPVVKTYRQISPVGGLNTKDSLAAMPEEDAVIIDNLFCQPTWVELRGGKKLLATFTGNPETLMAYNALGSGGATLFACVNNAGTRNIYRVDNAGGGAVGAAVVSGLGSTNIDYNQFGTGSGNFLVLVDGVDSPIIYDGTTWQVVTGASAPFAWTGFGSLSSLSQVAVYKQRLWFVQANTFNVYYLPQNVVGGVLTLLNIGPNFKLGGSIAAVITVSIDNSAGTNDYIAFVSTMGEVIMFQGYDPASVTTFSVAAHFRIGAPIGTGRQCWQKMGMDAAIICQDGLILLSEAMLTDRSQQKLTLSDKVRYGINQAIALYGTNLGWSLLLYPAGNKLVLNVPTTGNRTTSYQYVMSTLTGSWVTWGQLASPLNISCQENYNNQWYFGSPGAVYQGDTGLSDNGTPITWNVEQAFSEMGAENDQKRWTQSAPFFVASGGISVALTMNVDYNSVQPAGLIPLSQSGGAQWNVALWTTPTFWADAQQIVKKWIGTNVVGTAGAMYMQGSAMGVTMKWMMTKHQFEVGGTFYGP